MDLGLAGAISGAGEGASKALTMGQAQIGASMLQEQRDKMDDLRQQRLFENTEKMHAQTEAGAERRLGITEAGAERRQKESLAATAGIHAADVTSREKISSDTIKNAKEMNAATNAMHERVAEAQRKMHERQFDKTFTQAKLTALKDTIRELGNEITRLSVVVANPLVDKTDPSYKSAVIQLESATKLHNLYAKQVGLEMEIDESTIDKSINKPPLPPLKMPGSPAASRTPGMIQTPLPSTTEQEMMQKSLAQ